VLVIAKTIESAVALVSDGSRQVLVFKAGLLPASVISLLSVLLKHAHSDELGEKASIPQVAGLLPNA
jgi:uncharacterized membrane protein YvlD (DUF360 family)